MVALLLLRIAFHAVLDLVVDVAECHAQVALAVALVAAAGGMRVNFGCIITKRRATPECLAVPLVHIRVERSIPPTAWLAGR